MAEQLIKYRQQHQYNQEFVAQQAHVNRQTISNRETGETLPDIYNLVALSDLYQVSLDELIKYNPVLQQQLGPNKRAQINWFGIAGFLCVALGLLNSSSRLSGLDFRWRVAFILLQAIAAIIILFGGYRLRVEYQSKILKKIEKDEYLEISILYWVLFISAIITVPLNIWFLGN